MITAASSITTSSTPTSSTATSSAAASSMETSSTTAGATSTRETAALTATTSAARGTSKHHFSAKGPIRNDTEIHTPKAPSKHNKRRKGRARRGL
ncbi:hypothetical protein FRB95_011677 [Tulasnella sp. JGI-2019a]|nr:hypothetical protein FRB95_011677 [Tulasnella sp. JGI-2019a]